MRPNIVHYALKCCMCKYKHFKKWELKILNEIHPKHECY